MKQVEFTKAFANKKKGDKGFYDGQLASHLVRVDQVAKYVNKKK
jgi:hypothetical protein